MNLETFYPYILPEVLTCPEPVARMALISAANEFCQGSLAWNAIETELLVNGVSEYEPSKPSQSYIITFKSVFVGTRQLTAIKGIVGDETGSPFYYTTESRGTIRIYPTPADPTESMTLDVAYGPEPSATTLPDFIGQRFIDVVSAGAKAKLMMMSGAVWANPQLAAYYQQVFRDGTTAARIEEEHGRNPSLLTIKPRSFG